MNCMICPHNKGQQMRDCMRFCSQSDECLVWREHQARSIVKEAEALICAYDIVPRQKQQESLA